MDIDNEEWIMNNEEWTMDNEECVNHPVIILFHFQLQPSHSLKLLVLNVLIKNVFLAFG